MFNWVCPQCGKDVPPSKTECPFCAERAKEAGQMPQGVPAGWQPPQGQPAPPPPSQAWQPPAPAASGPRVWQPPASAAPPPPPPAPPPPAVADQAWPPQGAQPHGQPWPSPGQQAWYPPQRQGLPTWAMGLIFAAVFVGVGAAILFGLQRFGRTNAAEKAGIENPSNASLQKVTNPLQKVVEVVGLRMMTEDKKPVVRFVVVNHSGAEIAGLAANVTLWASTSRSEEDSVGSFSFETKSLQPYGSQEMKEPLKTKLKMYELPDWQNATAEIQITSPQP